MDDPEDPAAAVRTAAAGLPWHRLAKLRLWLSGGLCLALLDLPFAGVERAEERERILQARLVDEGRFSRPPGIWLERASPLQPRLAAAFDAELLRGIVAALAPLKAKVCSVRPWWSDALRVCSATAAADRSAALAVIDCDSLTVLAGSATSYQRAVTVRCPSRREALQEWQRQRIGLAGTANAHSRGICLNGHVAEAPAADELAGVALAAFAEALP
ncbi:MAG: hypothetical protein QM750_20520 [Rubrivivax sp.]